MDCIKNEACRKNTFNCCYSCCETRCETINDCNDDTCEYHPDYIKKVAE